MPEISKKLENLPFAIKKHSKADEKVEKKESYKFSAKHTKYLFYFISKIVPLLILVMKIKPLDYLNNYTGYWPLFKVINLHH
jgi:hypothetical protein